MLLVAAVQGEVDVLLRVILHLIGLGARELDQIEADLHDNISELGHEDRAELLVARCNDHRLEQLDNELRIVGII